MRNFIDTLTSGGGEGIGNLRPIEMHAHDPPRYVGGMLAWLHQAVPSEKEALEILLSQCQQIGKQFLLLALFIQIKKFSFGTPL